METDGICPIRAKTRLAEVFKNHSFASVEGCESAYQGEGCLLLNSCLEYKRMKSNGT